VLFRQNKITIGRQDGEVVPNAQLREQRVDRPEVDT